MASATCGPCGLGLNVLNGHHFTLGSTVQTTPCMLYEIKSKHPSLVTHICVSELDHRRYGQWLVAGWAPSPYLPLPLMNKEWNINLLAPGRSLCDFKNVIFNLALLIGIFKSSYDNILRWMPQDFTDDKSTLVQVMAWCRQATSHYLNQCWPRSPTPYGVTRLQWVKQCTKTFNQENAVENVECKTLIIMFWGPFY